LTDLSIIIISYNTQALTLDCLRSVYEQTKNISFEVVVLDNDSSDGSADAIEQQFPQVKLIRSRENLGFAEGNNVAARKVVGEYLLLLNPDTVVLEQAIEKLLICARRSGQDGIFGGRTYDGEGRLDPTSCWRKPSLWSLFCFAVGLTAIFNRNQFFDPESYGGWPRDEEREVDIVTGCFLLLRTETWRRLHGFDPEFFMYAEEADLCLRAKKNGVRARMCPDAKIIHYGGASERVVADKMVRMLKAKNMLIRKHWDHRYLVWLGGRFYLTGAFLRAWGPSAIFSPSEKSLQWKEVWSRRQQWLIE